MKKQKQQPDEKKKKNYVPPSLDVVLIEMETGIVATSVVQPGGGTGVEVDPWTDGGSAGSGEPSGEWWK
ncbi:MULTISPECIES: hypothetical protein [Elizabethkingia]|uniref:Uncharacterized protein n=1 Tax=Elizabethkingia ursingii TaxID=1756150 RepID=A0AAJ3TQ20_9FLAO|nr:MULTISPECIES: hypothetical protein [Elizabethkingia]AQW92923.1 hypothetical protein BBD30_01310 [Elizabethkingia anophelis]AQX09787.1 hypothetical protein BBD34_14560 [Elizabethkingia ursingii]OPB61465.1 hypothetical protein BAS07_16950 [Elizabethkingia anophelis]OPB78677.1 hypothetical protein BAY32_00630 [Elizabethkingia ursingii]OPB92836.1 hypothetical protein BB021_00075 [Elizabethkingia ursingii]